MSIAKRTREAVERHPYLVEALRAGVVNYTAAARFLDVGEVDAVAAALRRYANELERAAGTPSNVRLRMVTGIGPADRAADALIVVDEQEFAPGTGELTAVVSEGEIDPWTAGQILLRLANSGISPEAVAISRDRLIMVTDRERGPTVLRIVEEAFERDSRD